MTISLELRQLVAERAGHRCEYCRTTSRLTGMALEIDHILPLARGGGSTAANLCLVHGGVNNSLVNYRLRQAQAAAFRTLSLSKGEPKLWPYLRPGVLACRRCNAHKSYRTHRPDPQTGELIPLFNPRRDSWRDHFVWNETGDHLLGKTPTGQVTIEVLQINDPLIVRARALWVSAGWHPPAV